MSWLQKLLPPRIKATPGIDFLLTPGVALMRGGRSYCSQLIVSPWGS